MNNTYKVVNLGKRGARSFEHVLIAESVLGKKLPAGVVVHHADGNETNNTKSNLVICPSQAYHMLLHRRMRALEASGNPDWRKCNFCKTWDDPVRLKFYGDTVTHSKCVANYVRDRKAR